MKKIILVVTLLLSTWSILFLSHTQASTYIQGDLDHNGKVDIYDYNLLVTNFGMTNCGNLADIDGNCKVDIFDYNILVTNFGRQNPTPTPSGIALGIFEPPLPFDEKTGLYDYSNLFAYGPAVDQYKNGKNGVGKYPAFAWISVKWQNAKTGQYNQFDPAVLDQYLHRGIMPSITWDASKGEGLKHTDQPDFSWKAIASGKQDDYIHQFAKDAAAYHYPFVIRLFEEMEGKYYPWGYNTNSNTDPADFVTAWKHVVDIFRKEGAANVQFVWCQAAHDQKQIDGSTNGKKNSDILKQLYPGDDYVDWIGLDGYAQPRNNWRSLQDEFQPSYQLLTSFSTRPMMLYEMGAAEKPGDPMFKANWITQGFLTTIPTQFPAVKVVNWLNAVDVGYSGADYSVDTSQKSLDAWNQVVSSPLYQGSL